MGVMDMNSPWSAALLLTLGVSSLSACATGAYRPDDVPARPDTGAEARVLGQLDGHLARVRSCLGDEGSGLLDVGFTIGTDGRVHGTEVQRNTSGSASVADCVHRRIASLYFDPAPAQPIERQQRFAFCREGRAGTCRLGPVQGAEDPFFADAVRTLEERIVACHAARAPQDRAILSVELTVGTDGKVSSGWVPRALPSGTPLAECAVRPLLNQEVTREAMAHPRTVRFTLGLPPMADATVAAN